MTQQEMKFGKTMVNGTVKEYKKYFTTQEYTPWVYSQKFNKKKGAIVPPVYIVGTPYADWINREDIRHLLHIPTHV